MPWKQYYSHATEKLKAIKLPKDAAGHSITARVPIALSDETVATVKERLFQETKQFDTINYIYVLSKHHRLVGVFSIKELFTNSDDTKVTHLYSKPPTVSRPRVDQERVAHLAIKHNIKSVPIVDDHGHFLGIVPSDKILAILNQEHREDVYRFAGIIGHGQLNLSDESALKGSLHRAPWILFGILGGLVTAKIVGVFEPVLNENILLAGFIPLVAYVANAVGVQTQTLMIREMSVNHAKTNWLRYSSKQLLTSLLVAISCFVLLFGLSVIIWRSIELGFVVGLSVVSAVMVASIFALAIPLILDRLGQDPAVGSGPFATILQDMLSILIYFSVAWVLM